nr:Ada metal-binding domain-containing protein [Methyloceanibacter marginalis]
MSTQQLTGRADEFFRALQRRDASYEGIFVVGVKTTGIFCRPTCSARKPLRANVEFFPGAHEALYAGFRPCLRCKPMHVGREVPPLVEELRRQVEEGLSEPLRDRDLMRKGIDPSTARRQFQRYFGMSFHAYQRARRMGSALAAVRKGTNLLDTQLAHGFESSSGFREAFAKLFGTVPSKANGVHCLFARWIETPLGAILVLANDSGLYVLDWVDRRGLEREILRLRHKTKFAIVPGDHQLLDQANREIGEYFRGTRARSACRSLRAARSFKTRLECAVGNSARRNAVLCGNCQKYWRTESRARRGSRQWRQLPRNRDSLSPSHRQRRFADRLWWRAPAKEMVA